LIRGDGEDERRVQLKSDVIGHDTTLVEIRSAFEKNPTIKNFLTENALQSSQWSADSEDLRDMVEIRSDAAVQVVLKGSNQFWIPLEYESSLKSVNRCQQKLANYYNRYDGEVVFFICKNEAVLKRMREIEMELSKEQEPKMYFALLADVLISPTRLTFQTLSGSRHTFA
jgi:hypothetical protein